jgi:methylmalonyl-CoA epimerase
MHTADDIELDEDDNVVAALQGFVLGIDHIAIAVADLAVAIRWYSDTLGLKLLERRTTRGAHTSMDSAVLAAGRFSVVLVQGNEPDCQVSKFVSKFGAGVQHVAFEVTDLDETLERVSEAGGAADTPMIAGSGIRQVFLRRDAGSGVRIELIERRGGSFSDQTVDQLFRAFESRGLY